jgi:hypothetical protein
MPQIQVTLTPAESKRLIGKGVAALPEVKRALREGTVIIALGTTNAYVAEELLGRKMDRERFVAGVVLPKGTCFLPEERRLHEIIIRKGKVTDARMDEILQDLTPKDVFIKGANAIDSSGMAGIFMGSPTGGTMGKVLGVLVSRGVKLIIPVGLEKFVPSSVLEAAELAGKFRFTYATGCPVGVMPVPGKVVNELTAIQVLTGARAIVIGRGGVSGAGGSVTLLIEGAPGQLHSARRLVDGIKGEPDTRIETDCRSCGETLCGYRKRHSS